MPPLRSFASAACALGLLVSLVAPEPPASADDPTTTTSTTNPVPTTVGPTSTSSTSTTSTTSTTTAPTTTTTLPPKAKTGVPKIPASGPPPYPPPRDADDLSSSATYPRPMLAAIQRALDQLHTVSDYRVAQKTTTVDSNW